MNSKDFKQMIKQHKVKLDFVLVDIKAEDYCLVKFYKTTGPDTKWYSATWRFNKGTYTAEVVPINTKEIDSYWLQYKAEVEHINSDDEYKITIKKVIAYCDELKLDPLSTMPEKKAAFEKARSLRFILKEARFKSRGTQQED